MAHNCLKADSPTLDLHLGHLSQLHPQLHLPTLCAGLQMPPTPERWEPLPGPARSQPWTAARRHYASCRAAVLRPAPAQARHLDFPASTPLDLGHVLRYGMCRSELQGPRPSLMGVHWGQKSRSGCMPCMNHHVRHSSWWLPQQAAHSARPRPLRLRAVQRLADALLGSAEAAAEQQAHAPEASLRRSAQSSASPCPDDATARMLGHILHLR